MCKPLKPRAARVPVGQSRTLTAECCLVGLPRRQRASVQGATRRGSVSGLFGLIHCRETTQAANPKRVLRRDSKFRSNIREERNMPLSLSDSQLERLLQAA